MNDIKNRTSQQIQGQIQQVTRQQFNAQKNGNYVQAQNSMLKVEQLKKDLEERKVYQMEQRHQKQIQQIQTDRQNQQFTFNKIWEVKIHTHHTQADKLQKDMITKHQLDLEKAKIDLQKQLPTKIKQSSELLNLRKMEEHMVKQKNYAEAHKVQARVQELEKNQKEAWMNNRSIKIETSLNLLRNKQAAEMTALKKKLQTALDELDKERNFNEQTFEKKFNNILKQTRSQHEKQILHFRGQFKSKGGQSSPMSSKSRIR